MPRITAAEKQKRINQITELLLTGHSRADICRFASEMGWETSERQIERYISAANDDFRESSHIERDREIGKAQRRFERLFRQSYQIKDYKTAMQVQEKLIALFALAAKDDNNDGEKPAQEFMEKRVEAIEGIGAVVHAPDEDPEPEPEGEE